jgi:holo-[acyl-carrier protein] synthase
MVVGVDLIEIPRFTRALERHGERLLARVFTPTEIQHARGHTPELAVRFAAKEAVSKALGVGMRMLARDGINWQDVEVVGDSRGKPVVRLYGRASERAQELGIDRWAISLSHTRDNAIALVVAHEQSSQRRPWVDDGHRG